MIFAAQGKGRFSWMKELFSGRVSRSWEVLREASDHSKSQDVLGFNLLSESASKGRWCLP